MQPKITVNPTAIEIADTEQLLEVAPVGVAGEFEVYVETERSGRMVDVGVAFNKEDLLEFFRQVLDRYGNS